MEALAKIKAAIFGVQSTVTGTRKQIEDLKSEREAIASAPLALADIMANLDVALKRKAAAYQPQLGNLAAPHAVPGLFKMIQPEGGSQPLDAIECFLAAVFGPQIREHYAAMLEEQYGGDTAALSRGERASALADIERRILGLECQEETLIEQAEDAGIMVDRRPDADPRAVLKALD